MKEGSEVKSADDLAGKTVGVQFSLQLLCADIAVNNLLQLAGIFQVLNRCVNLLQQFCISFI